MLALVACIGVGGRGTAIAQQAAQLGDIVAVCDVDGAHAAQAKLRQQKSMQEYYLARSMMARAMARLRVSNRNKINN